MPTQWHLVHIHRSEQKARTVINEAGCCYSITLPNDEGNERRLAPGRQYKLPVPPTVEECRIFLEAIDELIEVESEEQSEAKART